MYKILVYLSIVVCVFLTPLTAAEQDSVASKMEELDKLRKQLADIGSKIKGLKKAEEVLQHDRQQLGDVDQNRASANQKLIEDGDEWNRDAAEHKQRVDAFNARCYGAHTDVKKYQECLKGKERIAQQQVVIMDRRAALESRRAQLQRGMDGPVVTEDELQVRQDSLNEQLVEMNTLEQELMEQVHDLLSDTSFLEELEMTEQLSADCDDPTSSLETAHHCLQQIWDEAGKRGPDPELEPRPFKVTPL